MDMKITKEALTPYIVQQGNEMHKLLGEARLKYGHRYNRRNEYEMMLQKFGDPRYMTDLFYDEYLQIIAKKSKLPASIRNTVRKVMNRATQAFIDACEAQSKKESEQPKQPKQ